ncbi:hypothetical protein [Scytonema millei]|uniref:Uncharacterized protein n=1 Tax=Scytonema millei VB511283 TaxID=1245923 RepID=A0A9X5E893_9CYAN|nr:hypothetical protein [Scytonema millei]NHC37175.1 hypothetical protein [Scytonema millei VB511283]
MWENSDAIARNFGVKPARTGIVGASLLKIYVRSRIILELNPPVQES